MTIKIEYNKKKPSFNKLSQYLKQFIKDNEEYVKNLSEKDGYLAGEAAGCRNTAMDILDYIKIGRFNVDTVATKALRQGKWLNKK